MPALGCEHSFSLPILRELARRALDKTDQLGQRLADVLPFIRK
jgi:hypothetical protein